MQLLWSTLCWHYKTSCKWVVCKAGKTSPTLGYFRCWSDLDKRWEDAAELAGDLFLFARRCMAEFGEQAVRFCPVLSRRPGCFRERTPDFAGKVENFNMTVQRLCARSAKTWVNLAVVNRQRFVTMLPFLLSDGVHLNGDGLKTYCFSLRRDIVAALIVSKNNASGAFL